LRPAEQPPGQRPDKPLHAAPSSTPAT
jgi:hypothetical protein